VKGNVIWDIHKVQLVFDFWGGPLGPQGVTPKFTSPWLL